MKRFAALLLGLALCLTPLALAQEEKGEKKGGMSEPNLTWQSINFVLLIGLIGYFAVKKGGPFFNARAADIRKGIDDAEKIKAESDAKISAINSKLGRLDAEIASLRESAGSERRAAEQRLKEETQREIQRIAAHAGPPLTAQEYTDAGFALARDDEWEKAIEEYRSAIRVDRTYARAYGNLGFALNKLGKHEEAIQICTTGLGCARSSADMHRLRDARGFAKSRLKDFDGAIEDFTAAIGINSNNPKAYQHRAESHALAGSYKLAYHDASQALRLDGDFTPAFRLIQRLESQGLV